MAALMTDALEIFQGGVAMLSTFTNASGITAVDVVFAAFGGSVAIGMFSYAKSVLR